MEKLTPNAENSPLSAKELQKREMIEILTHFVYPDGLGEAHKEVRQQIITQVEQVISFFQDFKTMAETSHGYFGDNDLIEDTKEAKVLWEELEQFDMPAIQQELQALKKEIDDMLSVGKHSVNYMKKAVGIKLILDSIQGVISCRCIGFPIMRKQLMDLIDFDSRQPPQHIHQVLHGVMTTSLGGGN